MRHVIRDSCECGNRGENIGLQENDIQFGTTNRLVSFDDLRNLYPLGTQRGSALKVERDVALDSQSFEVTQICRIELLSSLASVLRQESLHYMRFATLNSTWIRKQAHNVEGALIESHLILTGEEAIGQAWLQFLHAPIGIQDSRHIAIAIERDVVRAFPDDTWDEEDNPNDLQANQTTRIRKIRY